MQKLKAKLPVSYLKIFYNLRKFWSMRIFRKVKLKKSWWSFIRSQKNLSKIDKIKILYLAAYTGSDILWIHLTKVGSFQILIKSSQVRVVKEEFKKIIDSTKSHLVGKWYVFSNRYNLSIRSIQLVSTSFRTCIQKKVRLLNSRNIISRLNV